MILGKYLANAGIASRRKVETLIRRGLVGVNGEVITEPAYAVEPEKDRITFRGKPVTIPEKRFFLLNKPAGVISTAADTHRRRTVLDLVPDISGLFPVGRLDKDTTGVLLITNDGELAYRLTHPRFGIEKVYKAVVKGRVGSREITRLEKGIELDGKTTAPARVKIGAVSALKSRLSVRIHEGRKRQVKRMFAEVGHPVIELRRVAFGPLRTGELKPGEYRELKAEEVERLKQQCCRHD